jgi:putative tricarboxylic transport membrane protein
MRRGQGELAVSVALMTLAAIVIWQAGTIRSPLYAQLGPRVMPYIVGGGLAALGAVLLAAALAGRWRAEPAAPGTPDLPALGWLAAGLTLNVALVKPLGFVVASTLLFSLVARGFGSARWARNAGIGFVIAMLAHLGFEKLLGIRVGAGILEGIL